MEQPHLSSQLEYLEQKYLESKETVARLQQRTEAQAYELQEQTRRVEALEAELTEARAQLARLARFDEELARFKQEVIQQLEDQSNRRQSSNVDSGYAMTTQLDTHTKTLHELRRELDKTHRYDEQITLLRTEVERLNKLVGTFQAQVDPLSKQLAERVRAGDYLEEQRRTDARRLAELQADLPNLQKRLDAGLSKIQTIEQQIPQFGKYEIALAEVREEIRRHYEHMDFQVAQRERQLKDWKELAESQERRMNEYKDLMEKYAEHYQLNKRALASLQDFQERVQREQHQATELQRLMEERQRGDIEKWQADYDQRWQRRLMEWSPQFTDFQKNIDQLKKQMDEMTKSYQNIEAQLDMVLQIIEEDVHARAMAVQDWRQRFEELANGQE